MPSADTNTPPTPRALLGLSPQIKRALEDLQEAGRTVLMPADFGIPHRKNFTPSELAPYLSICAKTVHRMIADEILLALPMRDGSEPKIPYSAVLHFFLKQQGVMN
jgi:hypothetical protein